MPSDVFVARAVTRFTSDSEFCNGRAEGSAIEAGDTTCCVTLDAGVIPASRVLVSGRRIEKSVCGRYPHLLLNVKKPRKLTELRPNLDPIRLHQV